jgi:hypothetical protein
MFQKIAIAGRGQPSIIIEHFLALSILRFVTNTFQAWGIKHEQSFAPSACPSTHTSFGATENHHYIQNR